MNKFNMFITAVCVLFLIKLRWPKNKSIYDTEKDLFGKLFQAPDRIIFPLTLRNALRKSRRKLFAYLIDC